MSVVNEPMLSALQNSYSFQLFPKLISNVTEETIKSLLPITFDIAVKKSITPGVLDSIRRRDQPEIERVLGGLLSLVKALLRENPDSIREGNLRQLLKSLNFNDSCSNVFVALFMEKKQYLCGVQRFHHYPQLKKFDWRVDIALSSSALNKSISTVIVMRMQHSNGDSYCFEISIAKFHMLRLYIATLLKEFKVRGLKQN